MPSVVCPNEVVAGRARRRGNSSAFGLPTQGEPNTLSAHRCRRHATRGGEEIPRPATAASERVPLARRSRSRAARGRSRRSGAFPRSPRPVQFGTGRWPGERYFRTILAWCGEASAHPGTSACQGSPNLPGSPSPAISPIPSGAPGPVSAGGVDCLRDCRFSRFFAARARRCSSFCFLRNDGRLRPATGGPPSCESL